MAWVHGDLNGANIILDAQGNVWLIDFFHTGPGARPQGSPQARERSLLHPHAARGRRRAGPGADADRRAVRRSTIWRRRSRRPRRWASPTPGSRGPGGRRASCAASIRSCSARGAIRCRRSIAMVRYAVHTLSFDESDVRQKQWALYTAGRAARRLTDDLRRSVPLRVDWLDDGRRGAGRAHHPAGTARSRAGRGGRHRASGRRARDGRPLPAARRRARRLRRSRSARALPRGRPGRAASADRGPERPHAGRGAGRSWPGCRRGSAAGGRVVVHCAAGLGRSGTIAACLLRAQGASAEEAIARVRVARGPRAVETEEQAAFVRAFAA